MTTSLTDGIWSLPVLSGTPALTIATVFVIPAASDSPPGIIVKLDDENYLILAQGQKGVLDGEYYELAQDDSSFTIVVDGTTSIVAVTSTESKTSLSTPTRTAGQIGTTSTPTQTRVGTSSDGVETSATTTSTLLSASTNPPAGKGVPIGVIVGIVVGVLVLLAIILGGMLLRRKKKQTAAKGIVLDEREGGGSDKIVVELEEVKDNPPNYSPRYTELSGNSQVQELGPESREVVTLRASGMSRGNGQTDELHGSQRTLSSYFSDSSIPPAKVPALASASAPAPSPYVEAQKKVEISWLESEEARLRQRREQLLMQNAERIP
jgi:hypothetical protein